MWRTDTVWLDLAVVMAIFAIGNILFGHFEAHRPPWRRVLKVAVVSAVVVTLSATAGRVWAFGFIGLMLLVAAYIHAYWLPKHGINGWTAEPRDKYLELVRGRR